MCRRPSARSYPSNPPGTILVSSGFDRTALAVSGQRLATTTTSALSLKSERD